MHNLSYKSLFLIIVFLLIPIVFLLRLQTTPRSALASWWNESWTYRQAINISTHSIGETNVYIITTINIGTTAKSQTDNGDFRFIDQSGQILSYYISNNTGTTAPTFHILLPTFPSGAQTIYTYYGNPSINNGFSSSPFTTQASNYTIGSPVAEETGGGPIAWWKFDEGVGTTTFDSSGQNNHGVFGSGTSAPTWANESQCVGGKCLNFSNNTLTSNLITNKTQNITFQFWTKWLSTSQTNGVIFYNGHSGLNGFGVNIGNGLCGAGNKITLLLGGTTCDALTSSTIMPTNQWVMITVTRDNSTWKMYLDGVFQKSGTTNPGVPTDNTSIGHNRGTGLYNGYIDDVKIYPYARSASQIKADYTSGLAGQSSSNSSTNIGEQSAKGLSDGLVGYWTFDEGIGTTSADSSGNSKTITLGSGTSAPAWSVGKYGIGLSFDGSNDYSTVSIGVSGQITVSAWVKSTYNSSYQNIVYGDGGVIRYLSLYQGNLRTYVSSNWRTSTATIPNDSWGFVTLTYDDNNRNLKMYVNGQLTYDGIETVSYPTNSITHIGRYSTIERSFNGLLDEIRIYNRALSPDEVKDLYEYAPGPIGYWKFEEASGTTAHDSSGSNRHATIQNGAVFSNGKYGKALGLNLNGPANQWASFTSLSHNYGFTKSAWIYPISTSQCGETRCSVIGPYFEILSNLQYYDNNLSPVGWKTGGSIPLNQWSYITVSNDNSFLKLFVNGIQVQSVGITNTGTHSSNAIGAYGSNSRNFHGLIDEVKIYNYARTQSQILEDMNVGSTFVSTQVGQTSQTIGGTTTNLEYCIPGDTSPCTPPIAEWKFEEGTGTTAFVSSGTSIHNLPLLTGDSSPTWSNGKIGKSLYFDGNDAIGYNNSSIANITGPVTVSAWIKTNSNASGGIACRYGNSGSWTYCLYMNASGKLIFLRSSQTDSWSTSITSTISINDNQWHYVTGRFDGSTMKVYVDSQEDGSVNETRSSNSSLWSFCIGNQHYLCNGTGYNGHFTGSIDHVRIYNYARTPAQIAYDYNKGEPVGWWKLDECQGSTAYDSSGIGNTGSISIGAGGSQTSVGTCTTSGAWFNGATGKNNSSLNFDGTDDKVNTLSPSNTLNAGWHQGLVTNGSFSLWAKTSNYTSDRLQPLLSSTDGYSNNKGISFEYDSRTSSNKRIVFKISKGTSGTFRQHCYVENILSDNNWHHWAVSVTPTAVAFYRDGVSLGSATCSPGTATDTNTGDTTYPLSIGGNGQTGFVFGGQLDDVRIYNYALTSTQVKSLYNGGALNFR